MYTRIGIKNIVLLLLVFVLSGCSASLNQKVKASFSKAKQAMEIKVDTSEYLFLYGNEKLKKSYLISLSMQRGDRMKFEETIELPHYYVSIDQNPEQLQQLVMNTDNHDASIVITLDKNNTVRNKTLKLEQLDYFIKTENTLKMKIVGDKTIMEDQWLGSHYSFYHTLELNEEYHINNETYYFLDMMVIDAYINQP